MGDKAASWKFVSDGRSRALGEVHRETRTSFLPRQDNATG